MRTELFGKCTSLVVNFYLWQSEYVVINLYSYVLIIHKNMPFFLEFFSFGCWISLYTVLVTEELSHLLTCYTNGLLTEDFFVIVSDWGWVTRLISTENSAFFTSLSGQQLRPWSAYKSVPFKTDIQD